MNFVELISNLWNKSRKDNQKVLDKELICLHEVSIQSGISEDVLVIKFIVSQNSKIHFKSFQDSLFKIFKMDRYKMEVYLKRVGTEEITKYD